MPLVHLVVVLIVVGVLLWLVNNYIPMDSKIKNILNIVVVVAVVLWLLNVFGVLSGVSGLRVGTQAAARSDNRVVMILDPTERDARIRSSFPALGHHALDLRQTASRGRLPAMALRSQGAIPRRQNDA